MLQLWNSLLIILWRAKNKRKIMDAARSHKLEFLGIFSFDDFRSFFLLFVQFIRSLFFVSFAEGLTVSSLRAQKPSLSYEEITVLNYRAAAANRDWRAFCELEKISMVQLSIGYAVQLPLGLYLYFLFPNYNWPFPFPLKPLRRFYLQDIQVLEL